MSRRQRTRMSAQRGYYQRWWASGMGKLGWVVVRGRQKEIGVCILIKRIVCVIVRVLLCVFVCVHLSQEVPVDLPLGSVLEPIWTLCDFQCGAWEWRRNPVKWNTNELRGWVAGSDARVCVCRTCDWDWSRMSWRRRWACRRWNGSLWLIIRNVISWWADKEREREMKEGRENFMCFN